MFFSGGLLRCEVIDLVARLFQSLLQKRDLIIGGFLLLLRLGDVCERTDSSVSASVAAAL